MVVNDPVAVAEVRAAFDSYESALLTNDLVSLDGWFWDDPRTIRFAFGDVQLGAASISKARRALPRQSPQRVIEHLAITTFGPEAATVFAVCRLAEGGVVLQSQTWARLDGTWRVVAAHVSNA